MIKESRARKSAASCCDLIESDYARRRRSARPAMPRSMRSPEVGSGTAAQLPSVRSVRSRQETNIAQTPELQAVATFDCAAKVQRTAEKSDELLLANLKTFIRF